MDIKRCTKCKGKKPVLTGFYVRSDNGRPQSACKACHSTASKLSYRANPVAFKEKAKTFRDAHIEAARERERSYSSRRRREALVAYSQDPPSCECCKEHRVEFLTIDHVDGKGAEHRRAIGRSGGRATYVWLRQNGWPPGFRVLCFNCNAAAGLYGACPHTYEREAGPEILVAPPYLEAEVTT